MLSVSVFVVVVYIVSVFVVVVYNFSVFRVDASRVCIIWVSMYNIGFSLWCLSEWNNCTETCHVLCVSGMFQSHVVFCTETCLVFLQVKQEEHVSASCVSMWQKKPRRNNYVSMWRRRRQTFVSMWQKKPSRNSCVPCEEEEDKRVESQVVFHIFSL